MNHSKRMDLKQVLSHKMQVEAAERAAGRTSLYNPLLQKPVSLEPVGPGSYPAGLGGYAYIGPPPDFGGSYGAYVDSSGRKQYGVKSSKQFSIYDGSPVQLHSELSGEERNALLTQMDEMSVPYKCESCRAELTVSAALNMEKVHCPYCSSEMAGAPEKVKQCYSQIQEKDMKTKEQLAAEAAAKAATPVKAEADIAKEAMKVEAPKDLNEKVPDPKAAKMEDNSPKAIKEEVMKEVTEPKETKVKSATEMEQEKVLAATQRRERLTAARKAFQDKKRKAALAAMKKKQVAAGTDEAKAAQVRRELRIMATLEPAKFAEIKKNPKLAAVCAEVEGKLYTKEERAQVRAELAEMAKADPAGHDKAKKELEFVAPEILMEKDEKKEEAAFPPKKDEAPGAQPALCAEGTEAKKDEPTKTETEKKSEAAKKDEPTKTETEKKAEAELAPMAGVEAPVVPNAAPIAPAPVAEVTAPDQIAESMKTEFLASLNTLKCERVEMSLHGEESADPFWNVIVDAEPVGRIHLADQENPDQIRAGFTADSYANNFGQAIQQVGIEKMMSLAKARLFAHKVDDTAALARVKAAAIVEAKADFDAKVQVLRQDFVKAFQTSIMASDKGLYNNEPAGHALKGGLFTALANLAIDPQHIVWAVEAGFEEAPQYFDFITQKAIEIMDMPKEARDSFENIVKASGKVEIAKTAPEEETLRDRLVKSSKTVLAMGGVVGGEDKDLIRSNMNLSPYRR